MKFLRALDQRAAQLAVPGVPSFPSHATKALPDCFFSGGGFVVNYSFFTVLLVFPACCLIDNYLSDAFSHICNIYSVTYPQLQPLKFHICNIMRGHVTPSQGYWDWGPNALCRELPCLAVCAKDQAGTTDLRSLVESKIKSNLQFIHFLSLQVLSIY